MLIQNGTDLVLPKGIETLSKEELSLQLSKMGEKGFRRQYPHPFLGLSRTPLESEEWVEPKTLDSEIRRIEPQRSGDALNIIVPVAKSDRNVYGSKVTLGRAKNNDIIMREPRISKLHATFIPKDDQVFQIMDMGSSNGTLVNGEPLTAREAVDLKSGDEISFWRYVFEFLSLDDLIRQLK